MSEFRFLPARLDMPTPLEFINSSKENGTFDINTIKEGLMDIENGKIVGLGFGKIKHILLSFYMEFEPSIEGDTVFLGKATILNSYTKIYSDLVIKLLQVFQDESKDILPVRISVIIPKLPNHYKVKVLKKDAEKAAKNNQEPTIKKISWQKQAKGDVITEIVNINKAIKSLASFIGEGFVAKDWAKELNIESQESEDSKIVELTTNHDSRVLNFWVQDQFVPISGRRKNQKKDKYFLLEDANSYNHADVLIDPRNDESLNKKVSHENLTKEDYEKICPSKRKENNGDSEEKEILLEKLGTNLKMVGGNIVAGDDFVLIGKNNLVLNGINPEAKVYKDDDEKLQKDIKELEDLYTHLFVNEEKNKRSIEKPIFFIGTKTPSRQKLSAEDRKGGYHYSLFIEEKWQEHFFTWKSYEIFPDFQPIYHLDLFMTPAGKNKLGQRRILVGQPVCTDHTKQNYIDKLNEEINESIEELTRRKSLFEIIRNPLPLTYVDINCRVKEEDTEDKENDGTTVRTWFLASYNNCIVQFCPQGNNNYCWLPTYGSNYSSEEITVKFFDAQLGEEEEKKVLCGDWSDLKQFDQENMKIWESLGFNVVKLTNYLPLARLRGAARCITKVLEYYPKDFKR